MKRRFLLTVFLLLAVLLQAGHARAKDIEVHFIDVGQGDSILVKTPNNKAILIDAGIHYTSQDKYNPFLYLKKLKVKNLDAIFITHSTVLKVGHHGSRTSTGVDFLKEVDPKYAVISCNDKDGKGKTYGHPHEPTLQSLKAQKVKLYRTDLQGTVVFSSDGKTITVHEDNEVSQDDQKLWEAGRKRK